MALRSFQERHGLLADGALGAGTYAALTTPLGVRVRQIELSLERSRWLPPQLNSPPILVNIPQFRLFAFYTTVDSENLLLQMNVIVGKTFPRNHTPVFAADMRFVVVRPYWDVPSSIVRDEFLPKIRAHPGWLASNRFELVRGEGDDGAVLPATSENIAALAAGALRMRQLPGDNNSLGVAKLLFPNKYNVYLHGTPAQALFAANRRAFSHGCVRVEDPLALAAFVLRDQPQWTRDKLEEAAKLDRPTRIALTRPLRVFILYATAIATESGRVLFFEDIYGHDRKLNAQLAR
jgi:murein L,D-transpeptidase YcbB/YkuD